MRDVTKPGTDRRYVGQATEVIVAGSLGTGEVLVEVTLPSLRAPDADRLAALATMTPEQFDRVVQDLAAVNARVQADARRFRTVARQEREEAVRSGQPAMVGVVGGTRNRP